MKLFYFVPRVESALGAACSEEEEEKVKANFRPLACEAQSSHQFSSLPKVSPVSAV